MAQSHRGLNVCRATLVALVVSAGTLIATRSEAITPTYDLNGSWSVTLKDVACEGTNQGPYPMNVTGFDKSDGDFDWNFHSGSATGTGVESGSDVVFISFGGAGSPDLTATAAYDNGVLTLTSVVGKCPNGDSNEWVFAFGGDLVVNSTLHTVNGTEARDGVCNVDPSASPPVCTLAQAITVSNDQGGDTIRFDILHKSGNDFDGSTPKIDVPPEQNLLITAPTVIDATTQPGGRVELSGSANNSFKGIYTHGLTVMSGGAVSTIEGLVINGFNEQIDLVGGDNIIQGNWLMTDAKGTASEWDPNGTSGLVGEYAQVGIDVESSQNTIGGTAPGEGNVFALAWSSVRGAGTQTRLAGALFDGAPTSSDNVIQGNDIGVNAHGVLLIGDRPKGMPSEFEAEPGLDIAGAQTVGGPDAGAGNRIGGAIISGPSTIQGNAIFGQVNLAGAATVGGPVATPGTGPGNVFEPYDNPDLAIDELSDTNAHAVIEGNVFDDPGHYDVASGVLLDVPGATVGGPLAVDSNLFSGLDTDNGAVRVSGGRVNVVVQNDAMTNNRGAGVQVDTGSGATITQVSMIGNSQGIELGTNGYFYNPKSPDDATGPSGAELYPQIGTEQTTASATDVTGELQQSGTIEVDLYAQPSCASSGLTPGQGEKFVGSQSISSLSGNVAFSFQYPALPTGMGAITMTATGSNGSTSEFSPCLDVNSSSPSLTGTGVVPTSTTVPVLPGGSKSSIAPRLRRQLAPATGHATIELLCPGGAQSPCTGTALVVVPGTKFHDATLAQTSFSMPAGTVSPVAIMVGRDLYASLRKTRRLSTRLTTTASDASGSKVRKSFTVTLVLSNS
jgi:hypothetical protein